jgi:hypothetical protein
MDIQVTGNKVATRMDIQVTGKMHATNHVARWDGDFFTRSP